MNKTFTTKKIVLIGILAAVSIVLVYLIRFPIFPATPFLEYDPADIPILIATFALGPIEGLVLTFIVSIIQGLTVSSASGPIGILMHLFATGSFVLVSGFIYRRFKTRKGAVLALALGVVTMTLTMVLWNIIFTPIFLGVPLQAVMEILPFIVLFNLIKAGVNAVVAALLYKTVGRLVN